MTHLLEGEPAATWDWMQATHWHGGQVRQLAHAETGSAVEPRPHQHLMEEHPDGYLHSLGCHHVSMRFLYSESTADQEAEVEAL